MKDLFLELDHRALPLIEFIGGQAERLGMKAYLVGGLVRDLMLKRESLDLDIVVEGSTVALAQAVAESKNGRATFFPAFKTATVIFSNGIAIDFATARRETYKTSGALPEVFEGTIQDDLLRRDFTINAMAVAINPGQLGMLLDDFGGLKDLKEKKIRVLHDKSFLDDPTRILRALRFVERLTFQVEAATLRQLKQAISRRAIDRVKPPRWFQEFRKILNEDNAADCIRQLTAWGAMGFVAKPFKCDVKLLKRIQKAVSSGSGAVDGSLVYVMALVERLSEKKKEALLQSWSLTRQEVKKILSVTAHKKILKALSSSRLANSQIYRTLEGLSPEALLFLSCAASNRSSQKAIKIYQEKLSAVRLEISGEDIKNLGINEGKQVKVILDKVLNRKIDGQCNSRREELEHAQRLSAVTTIERHAQ